jgi:hypothetical protein
MEKRKVKDLGANYSIFGNKGNVWTGTSHAYKSGHGNLCGTPALSTNWARIEGIEEVGCPQCLEKLAEAGDECSLCGEEIAGHGNNAEPVSAGRCCDSCNLSAVIPARLANAFGSRI